MWQNFKLLFFYVYVLVSFAAQAQSQNGVVYNLEQNWEQYNPKVQAFLPKLNGSSNQIIYFKLDLARYSSNSLFIHASKKLYLFYEQQLLTQVTPGNHFYAIDSLTKLLPEQQPRLAIYGAKSDNALVTYITNSQFEPKAENLRNATYSKNYSFSNYLIIVILLLLLGLIMLKFKYSELFSQYSNLFRGLNINTTDELLYKGRFFASPGIFMMLWISFASALILHYFIYKFGITNLGISLYRTNTTVLYFIYWFLIALGFLVLFIVRYILIMAMAYIFDMQSIRNIHFANHLRLSYYVVVVVLAAIILDFFTPVAINASMLLLVVFVFLSSIILLIGLRLSFVIRHSFVQLFLYLCATEIFLFVFVYKLVVG